MTTAEFELKTQQFVSQDVESLADQLLANGGMVIAVHETDTRLRIRDAYAWASLKPTAGKKAVGQRYKDWGIADLTPGDLWSPPARRILQSLIISQDEDGIGACVQLLSAEFWDPLTQRFVDRFITAGQEFKTDRQGDITKFLGLQPYERSSLRFLDKSDTLYIVRAGQIYNKKRTLNSDTEIQPEQANHQLGKLLK